MALLTDKKIEGNGGIVKEFEESALTMLLKNVQID